MAFTDDAGNEVLLGDVVRVTALDSGAGAHLYMTQSNWTVVGFGRTRLVVSSPSISGTVTVHPRLVHITVPVDGRTLRTFAEIWAERNADA